jgi:hypothetical protein
VLSHFPLTLSIAAAGAGMVIATPPPTSTQSAHLDDPYPDAQRDLNRWLPLVKWLLAIPHDIVLVFLNIAALVVVIAAWFASRTAVRNAPETEIGHGCR